MLLHSFQAEALARLTHSRIHLALTAPTGSGKGLILEELARNPRERILILTPLIALGRQQRLRLRGRGIPEDRVRILSPESALLRGREIREWKPTLIAVDEAHCLPEWGARFRPAYGRLLAFIEESRCPRTLWMSATFPRTLLEELELRLPGPWFQMGRFRIAPRLAIEYRRVSAADRIECVRDSALVRPEPGLLFAGTRKDVARYLGILSPIRPFLPYHAGLADEERRSVELALSHESEEIDARTSVVATNAFGMGMDFPQFRWAILGHMPYSLLSLMQAFGRVGRAGKSGNAALYWTEEDFRFAGLLIGTESDAAQAELHALRRYIEGSETDRRSIESEAFL